jgi:hypothetical protein
MRLTKVSNYIFTGSNIPIYKRNLPISQKIYAKLAPPLMRVINSGFFDHIKREIQMEIDLDEID